MRARDVESRGTAPTSTCGSTSSTVSSSLGAPSANSSTRSCSGSLDTASIRRQLRTMGRSPHVRRNVAMLSSAWTGSRWKRKPAVFAWLFLPPEAGRFPEGVEAPPPEAPRANACATARASCRRRSSSISRANCCLISRIRASKASSSRSASASSESISATRSRTFANAPNASFISSASRMASGAQRSSGRLVAPRAVAPAPPIRVIWLRSWAAAVSKWAAAST